MAVTARVTLLHTAHQASEIAVALLLGYGAIHRSGPTAASLITLAAGAAMTAVLGPGLLSARVVLRAPGRRVADLALAVGCLAVILVVTRTDLVATAPLALAGLVLVRLSGVEVPASSALPSHPGAGGHGDVQVQSTLNRFARAAGVFVRSQRALEVRDKS